MKTRAAFLFFLAVSTAFLYCGCSSSKNNGSDTEFEPETIIETAPDSGSLETFQDSLSNYGEFINIDSSEVDPENSLIDENSNTDDDIYSNYIWVPNSNYLYEGWTPFIEGRWVWTDWGWTWVSDYSWGWATYHYGRWWYSEAYGWVWSPGRVWGPAWVNWCNNGEYTGWYPISPRIHLGHGGISTVNPHYHHNGWVFTPNVNLTDPLTKSTVKTGDATNETLKTSTPFVNIKKEGKIIFNSGPEIKEIEKVQGKKIGQKPLTEVIDFHLPKKGNKNASVNNENTVITVDSNKKTTDPKSKTNVNNITNYNTTKTYNSTETYNKTNTGSEENSDKTEIKNKTENTNKNGNINNMENTNKTGNTNNPGSTNKTGTSNKTGSTSPKVSQTPKVITPPPVKQSPPPPVKQSPLPPSKESSPPQQKSK